MRRAAAGGKCGSTGLRTDRGWGVGGRGGVSAQNDAKAVRVLLLL